MMADMNLDEMRSYAARHGLTTVTAENLDRIRALSAHVAATGRAIRRIPDKADEPATIFAGQLAQADAWGGCAAGIGTWVGPDRLRL